MNEKVQDKLLELFTHYKEGLPDKIKKIELLWGSLSENWDVVKFNEFQCEVQNINASASTYGFFSVNKAARELEFYLKTLFDYPLLTPAHRDDIAKLVENLKQSVTIVEEPTRFSFPKSSVHDNVICILDEDALYKELQDNIDPSVYKLQRVSHFAELESTLLSVNPAVLVMDVGFLDENNETHINQLLKKRSILLFCTSTNADFASRLRAIRAGSIGFFHKPVDFFQLTKTLEDMSATHLSIPYRILILDDAASLAEYYSIVLTEAGMVTKVITDPIHLMKALEDFQPDLLLSDIYLPTCTGFELATLLRQDPLYVKLPIIFLSTEDDRFKQLAAINLGGDDFLTKPVLPEHLISAVKSRAKRGTILSTYITTDSLTGALNHATLLQRLEVEISRAKRQNLPLSFVMIDVDYFKTINDTYGHLFGDQVLKKLVRLFFSRLRKIDLVGRYGGEEFSLVLPNTDEKNSLLICDKLREKFAKFVFHAGQSKCSVTFSAGIASYPTVGDVSALISGADKALYQAKEAGRNQVHCFVEQASL